MEDNHHEMLLRGESTTYLFSYATGKGSCLSSMVTCSLGWTVLIVFLDDMLFLVLSPPFDKERVLNQCQGPDPH